MVSPTKILTPTQLRFLDLFNSSDLVDHFYLSGGTALCGFYIPYRYSEDLDFFSREEFDIQQVVIWLKSVKSKLNYIKLDLQTSFNRNLIFLEFENETLKTEFTYFPFFTKKQERYLGIYIDSLEDIALNKLFTIYQNPRLRDYMDLFMITEKEGFNFSLLRKDVRIKFDWHIDPIQLGSQLLRIKEKKDKPNLIQDFDFVKMEDFYFKIVKNLKKDVLSS